MTETKLHADATRATHYRDLLRNPMTIGGTFLAVAVATVGVGELAGAAAAAGAGAGALLIAALIVWILADARAEHDFFGAYAAARSLTTGGGRGELPEATALLRKGVRRYTDRAFAGKLDGRVDGVLAYYTYETEYTDSKGRRHVEYHNFTVAMTAIPEAASFLGEVACQRRAGFRFFDKAEDAFRSRQRVELESEELDKRYEIFIGPRDDQNRARQLFTPTFMDWLTTADEDLGFELEGGMLVVNVPGQYESAEELDRFSEWAAEITERISSESMESLAHGAEHPASDFRPGSFIATAQTGKLPERTKRRLWALFFVGCMGVGLAVGFATREDDSTDDPPSAFQSSPADDSDPDRLSRTDRILLAAVAKLRRGRGVYTEDLYDTGVPTDEVELWAFDAMLRGLVDYTVNGTYRITPKGERALERARK